MAVAHAAEARFDHLPRSPDPAGRSTHHRRSHAAAECRLKLRHVLHHTIDTLPTRRVRIRERRQAHRLVPDVLLAAATGLQEIASTVRASYTCVGI